MTRSSLAAPLSIGALFALAVGLDLAHERRMADAPSAESGAAELAAPKAAPEPVRRSGYPPRRADRDAIALAEGEMGPRAQRARCGPYTLWTDVADAWALELCDRIGTQLDAVYRARFGIAPRGRPSEGIFLFADIDGYRRFAAADGRVRVGYAGYANTANGFVALYAADSRSELAATLAHELTHLVHRRALGPDLAPWLSEGLAEAIGDSASVEGIGPLEGKVGASVAVERLRGAYARGGARSLERLVGLDRQAFDRGSVSFDYEQSALFVRYLLLDPVLGGPFRSYLRDLAEGERSEEAALPAALGVGWAELETGLVQWLELP